VNSYVLVTGVTNLLRFGDISDGGRFQLLRTVRLHGIRKLPSSMSGRRHFFNIRCN